MFIAAVLVESEKATKGRDIEALPIGSSKGAVEFLPGQRRAALRIRILEDTAFEGVETFKVILSSPKNGLLAGKADTHFAHVQIDDPEDGKRLTSVRDFLQYILKEKRTTLF